MLGAGKPFGWMSRAHSPTLRVGYAAFLPNRRRIGTGRYDGIRAVPDPLPRPGSVGTVGGSGAGRAREEEPMQKYVCGVCGYVYDPKPGDPDNGVPPGTPFEQLPDSWRCPDCGVTKDSFTPEGG